MRNDKSRFKLALLGIALGCSMNAAAYAACGEASCVAAQGAYISHFTGANCTGTESYYTPYDGGAYQCRPWNGTGNCGTILRTVTNRSYRDSTGQCRNAWPNGNQLSGFVTVYRDVPKTPPVACGWSSQSSGYAPLGVSFYGNCSYDPDGGSITSYYWSFGGSGSGFSSYWYHTFYNPGSYPIWLDVVDDEGQTNSTFIGYVNVY